jgi:hypothetical protein
MQRSTVIYEKRKKYRGPSDPDKPSALYGGVVKYIPSSLIGKKLIPYSGGPVPRFTHPDFVHEFELPPDHRIVYVDRYGAWRSRPVVEVATTRLTLFMYDTTIVAVAYF